MMQVTCKTRTQNPIAVTHMRFAKDNRVETYVIRAKMVINGGLSIHGDISVDYDGKIHQSTKYFTVTHNKSAWAVKCGLTFRNAIMLAHEMSQYLDVIDSHAVYVKDHKYTSGLNQIDRDTFYAMREIYRKYPSEPIS